MICGHIHHAAMHDLFGVAYVNTGDWVESCTAVVEHYDGAFELIRWTEVSGRRPATKPRRALDVAREGGLMRLLIATDAWRPQINGVVRSLEYMAEMAPRFGAEVDLPDAGALPLRFRCRPIPRSACRWRARAWSAAIIETSRSDPYPHRDGRADRPCARALPALAHGRAFTTSYHTRFPEYLAARAPIPEAWSYGLLRRFHNGGRAMMVSTPSLERELTARGFRNILRWTRGVDTDPVPAADRAGPGRCRARFSSSSAGSPSRRTSRPSSRLDLPGTKVVVGDGPARADLERQYPAGPLSRVAHPARIWRGSMPPRTSSSSRA